MATRRFSYDGEEWEVETTGIGTGAGASSEGHFPPITRWSVVFSPLKGSKKEVHGTIGAPDPNKLEPDQLVNELRHALRSSKKR